MAYITIFLLSATPVLEQRAAIPFGIIACDINPYVVFAVSYLGSFLPVPFILILFNIVFDWMKRFRVFNKFVCYIQNKLDKGSRKIDRYKEIGLIILVAIPLPTTGMWTGSAVASFLGLDFKKSLLYIATGGLISAVLITILSIIFPAFLGY